MGATQLRFYFSCEKKEIANMYFITIIILLNKDSTLLS